MFLYFQDVISHSQNLRNKSKANLEAGDATQAGLKSLNKANRARLEGYQNLFYLLQVGIYVYMGVYYNML